MNEKAVLVIYGRKGVAVLLVCGALVLGAVCYFVGYKVAEAQMQERLERVQSWAQMLEDLRRR